MLYRKVTIVLLLFAVTLLSVNCAPYMMKAKMASRDKEYDLALDFALKHLDKNKGDQGAIHFIETTARKYSEEIKAEIDWVKRLGNWDEIAGLSARAEKRLSSLLRIRGIAFPTQKDLEFFQQAAAMSNLNRTEALYTAALAKYQAGDYQAALDAFTQCQQLVPHYKDSDNLVQSSKQRLAEEQYQKGLGYFNTNNFSEAIDHLEQSLSQVENYKDASRYLQRAREALAAAAYGRGQSYFRQGDYEQAIQEFQQSQELVANFMDTGTQIERAKYQLAQSNFKKGEDLLTQGQYQLALETFATVLKYKEDYPGAKAKYAEVQDRLTVRLAVLPFKAVGLNPSFGTAASEKIIANALPHKDQFLTFVDRENLQKVLEEQALGQTGVIDEKTAVQVGQLTGVNVIMTGKVALLGISDPKLTQTTKTANYTQHYRDVRGAQRKIEKPFNYTQFERKRTVNMQISYSLIDVATSQIIESKSFTQEHSDNAIWITCSKERVNDLPGDDKTRLSASQQPKATETLITEALENLGQQATTSLLAKIKSLR